MDQNKRAIVIGGIVTAVLTATLFFLPSILPLTRIKMVVFNYTNHWWFGNPFIQLRFFGGVAGGLIAGYLSRPVSIADRVGTSMKTGTYANVLGISILYFLYIAYNFANSIFVAGVFPPPFYLILVIPLLLSLPLIPLYLLEGILLGVTGYKIRQLLT